MPILHCSAILFDLDGVLVDSTRSVDRQWRLWARAKGVDEEKVMAIAHGVRALEVIRRVAPQFDAEAEVRELEALEAGDRQDVSVMPGAAALLRSIPDDRWGVVTSGTHLLASARLPLVGLPVPNVLVTADDVTHGKPHPEPYLKGAERLGFPPGDCLVIEDAPAGIQAAHAGGMKVIGLMSTFGVAQLTEADLVLKSLDQIRVGLNGARGLVVNAG
jgi:mannitol-1-/sugar-/sorbitol-6-phosphatase